MALSKALPSAAYLHKRLDYNPITGIFIWNEVTPSMVTRFRSWNSNHAGKIAGGIKKTGYVDICIDQVEYLAHRLAWKMIYGEDPVDQIDHINGNTKDNRILNLRESSYNGNMQNSRISKNNSTGIKNVHRNNENDYCVTIMANGVTHYRFGFKTPEAAEPVAKELRRKLHGDFSCDG